MLRDVVAGMVAAIHERAGHAVELLGDRRAARAGASCPITALPRGARDRRRPRRRARPGPGHERALGEWAKAEHGSDFVVVQGYPTAHRAFYTHPDPEDPHWSQLAST